MTTKSGLDVIITDKAIMTCLREKGKDELVDVSIIPDEFYDLCERKGTFFMNDNNISRKMKYIAVKKEGNYVHKFIDKVKEFSVEITAEEINKIEEEMK